MFLSKEVRAIVKAVDMVENKSTGEKLFTGSKLHAGSRHSDLNNPAMKN